MDVTVRDGGFFKMPGLTNNQLKIIAMLSMLIDHIGVQLFPHIKLLRIIGRLALPIFAYMIAEGCFHTRNRVKYLSLIAGLGACCQAVFYIFTGSLYLGILITFSLSCALIFLIDGLIMKKEPVVRLLYVVGIAAVLFFCIGAPIIFKGQGLMIDYGILGVLMPVFVYFARGKAAKILTLTVVLAAMGYVLGGVQWYALLAVPLLVLYNGKRGKARLKYVFYIFYPLHLAIIYLLGLFW